MERKALGQWVLGTRLVAATIGGVLIGRPMMNRAFAKLKGKLEG